MLEQRLAELTGVNERNAVAAEVILDRFETRGFELVVVGGSAVALWAPDAHTSNDIDIVGWLPVDQIVAVLETELGFSRDGRHWYNPELRLAIEFPGSVLEPDGAQSATIGRVRVISLEDLILDRTEQWAATGALEVLEQAIALLDHELLDADRLERRAADTRLADALEAVRLLAAHNTRSNRIDSALSHEAQRALSLHGVANVQTLLAGDAPIGDV
jgi:hypothetical protein